MNKDYFQEWSSQRMAHRVLQSSKLWRTQPTSVVVKASESLSFISSSLHSSSTMDMHCWWIQTCWMEQPHIVAMVSEWWVDRWCRMVDNLLKKLMLPLTAILHFAFIFVSLCILHHVPTLTYLRTPWKTRVLLVQFLSTCYLTTLHPPFWAREKLP